MWVLKLGGSLHASPWLERWLRAVCDHGAGKVVVVPGGGPFADQVRAAQGGAGLGERSAHAMALLAMAQYGLMLAGLRPELVPAHSVRGARARVDAGSAVVWLPSLGLARRGDIEASWRVTSDSLALWLAARLGAPRVCLVKSLDALPEVPSARGLAEEGVVYAAFPEYLARYAGEAHVLRARDVGAFEGALRDGRSPRGSRIAREQTVPALCTAAGGMQ